VSHKTAVEAVRVVVDRAHPQASIAMNLKIALVVPAVTSTTHLLETIETIHLAIAKTDVELHPRL
jgi:hypothetical protein